MRKIFKVMIYDKYYDVYDIEEKTHQGYNDTPTTWWLYYANDLKENELPLIDSEDLIPYSKSIQRAVWDIRFKQKTTTKEKWGYTNFNNHTFVEMICNGKLFYSFSTTGDNGGLVYAMAKVQYLQVAMNEHPFNFFEPEKENGRKIWWYNLPATIRVSSYNPWEIRIKPDYTTGFTKEEWWKEYKTRQNKMLSTKNIFVDPDEPDYDDEDTYDDEINWGDALSDGNIWWFRD